MEMTPRRQAMIDAHVAETHALMADYAFELNDLVRFALSAFPRWPAPPEPLAEGALIELTEALIRTLLHFGVTGHRVAGAPGIYVRLDDPGSHALLPQRPQKASLLNGGQIPIKSEPDFSGLGKIAALGIKVSRNCTYHGVALNVAMDLEPFSRINPCGYTGLQTVDLSTIGVSVGWAEAADVLSHKLVTYLAP